MAKPKIGYAMLGASNYPDSVMLYLTSLRFEQVVHKKYEGKVCPLCNGKMDRDHTIKCDYSKGIRVHRHDGIVNAIKKNLNKSRKATSPTLDNLLKPDIALEINNEQYYIDVNFSIEHAMQSRYQKKKDKYVERDKELRIIKDNVIPVIIGYDGIIWSQSIEDLKIVPEIDIKKLYEAIYYHIALA